MFLYYNHNPFDGISLFFRVLRKLNFTRAKACRDTFQDFNLRQLWRTSRLAEFNTTLKLLRITDQ